MALLLLNNSSCWIVNDSLAAQEETGEKDWRAKERVTAEPQKITIK